MYSTFKDYLPATLVAANGLLSLAPSPLVAVFCTIFQQWIALLVSSSVDNLETVTEVLESWKGLCSMIGLEYVVNYTVDVMQNSHLHLWTSYRCSKGAYYRCFAEGARHFRPQFFW